MRNGHFDSHPGDQIQAYVGPMGCGKTDSALTFVYNLEQSGYRVVAGKSILDRRGVPDVIASGSGKQREAYPIERLSDVQARAESEGIDLDQVQVVYIDEVGPFFEDTQDFIDTVFELTKMGKFIVVSSLEFAGNGLRFPTMDEILKFGPIVVPQTFPCQVEGCKRLKGTDTIVGDYKTERPFRTFSSRSGKRFPFKLPDNPSNPLYTYKVGCHPHAVELGRSALAIDYEEFAEREGISPDSYRMVA